MPPKICIYHNVDLYMIFSIVFSLYRVCLFPCRVSLLIWCILVNNLATIDSLSLLFLMSNIDSNHVKRRRAILYNPKNWFDKHTWIFRKQQKKTQRKHLTKKDKGSPEKLFKTFHTCIHDNCVSFEQEKKERKEREKYLFITGWQHS